MARTARSPPPGCRGRSCSTIARSNPNDCHTHDVQTIGGVATGSFSAPDHEYPSWLELVLTATDSGGLTGSTSVRLDPKTVTLSFATVADRARAVRGLDDIDRAVLADRDPGLEEHDHGAGPADRRRHDVQLAELVGRRARGRTTSFAPATATTYTATYQAATPTADVRVTQSATVTEYAGHHHGHRHERRARLRPPAS